MATVRKFLFLDPSTGLYKEQTSADTIQVANGVSSLDAVNKGQLDSVSSAAAAAVAAEQARAEGVESGLQSAIDSENSRAEAAEALLRTDLNAAIATFSAFDTQIASDLSAEIARAQAAESAEETARIAAVSAEASARAAAVSAEQARAESAESALSIDLASETSTRAAADSALSARLTTLEASDTTINSVRYLVKQAKDALEASLATETAARITGDEQNAAAISNETDARVAAISGLQSYVDSNINTLSAADVALGLRIDGEISDRSAAVSAEASARAAADTQLLATINTERARAEAIEANLTADIGYLRTDLNTEIAARIAGDESTLDAAKLYADGLVSGLDFKQSVLYAFPTQITAEGTTYNFPADGSVLINALSMVNGDRILLTSVDEQTGSVNAGIYVVASGALVRASDMLVGSSAAGAYVYVEMSATGSFASSDPGTSFVCSNMKGSDVVGTAALKWAIFSRAENLVFTGGLSKSGQEVSVVLDGVGGVQLTGSGLAVKIKDTAHIDSDASGVFLKGALVNGESADGEHKHSVITTKMTWSSTLGSFYKAGGSKASWDEPACFGFGAGGNIVVLSGVVEKPAASFAADAVLYLNGTGDGFVDFSSVPSGKYAIPVGKNIDGTKIVVQIGAPVLKA